MIYREFQGLKLSTLGMGAMRLPVKEGVYAAIDEEEVKRMVAYAMKKGINYYDTAWGYHDGQSEVVMGNVLSTYKRESYYLATKFPGYDPANWDKVEVIFEEQLKKCKTDYFDFYLIHNVCEMNIDAYLNPEYKIFDYLKKQKEAGRIRHLGFSVHGSLAVMKRFLDAYGEDLEFGQIQMNYLDWSFQDAKGKADLLKQFDIPIWVMEPLRGGSLSKLASEYEERLTMLRPEEKTPAWGFRFLQSIPEVTVILSGMSTYEQLEENIATFEEERPLTQDERKCLLKIADEMLVKKTVPCTACRYCTSHCPMELDIPRLIGLYNEYTVTGGGFIAPMVVGVLPENKRPSACIGCKSCEQVCPQQIQISVVMKEFSDALK